MNRRKFLLQAGATAAASIVVPRIEILAERIPTISKKTDKFLNAYYFRAHMYTMVPKQVRQDLQFMADLGTDAVSIAILEQDLFAAIENVDIIAAEADKLGMELHVVPSRWGGILAGAPKVPSIFTVRHPHTWILRKDQSFVPSKWSGAMSSIHYPETLQFFKESIDQCLKLWPVKGIIWDEPKLYNEVDHSPLAMENLSNSEDIADHRAAFSDFFGYCNAHIKAVAPSVKTSLFVYANLADEVVSSAAKISNLDYFGCDGRPWRNEDGGQIEQENKVLLGPGKRFLNAARENGKGAFWLIENHNMTSENNKLMDLRLPEVVAAMPEQLVYYFYPRNVDKPDDNMSIIAKHIKKYKG